MALMDVAPRTMTAADIVAANIRAFAGVKGLTQIDLARALGMSQGALQKRWVGQRQWQLVDLDGVAAALGVSLSDLVTPNAFTNILHPRQDSNLQPRDYKPVTALTSMWMLAA